jgi:hypothetical protein
MEMGNERGTCDFFVLISRHAAAESQWLSRLFFLFGYKNYLTFTQGVQIFASKAVVSFGQLSKTYRKSQHFGAIFSTVHKTYALILTKNGT